MVFRGLADVAYPLMTSLMRLGADYVPPFSDGSRGTGDTLWPGTSTPESRKILALLTFLSANWDNRFNAKDRPELRLSRRDHPSDSVPATKPVGEKTEAGIRRPQNNNALRGLSGLAFNSEYLVLAFTAFLIALIWGAIGYQIDHDRMAVFETAQVNTRNLARAYAEHVEGTLQLLDQALLRTKNEYETKSHNPDFLRRRHGRRANRSTGCADGRHGSGRLRHRLEPSRGVGCKIAAGGVACRDLCRRPRLFPCPDE